MTTTIGRVEFNVGADGRILEPELRRIGRQAGIAGGKALTGAMNKEVRQGFAPVRKSFRDLLSSIIQNTPALRVLQQRMERFGTSVRSVARTALDNLSTKMDYLRGRSRELGEAIRDRLDGPLSQLRERADDVRTRLTDLGDTVRSRVTSAFERASAPIRTFGARIRDLGPDVDAIRPKFRAFADELERFNRTSFRPRVFSNLSRALASIPAPAGRAATAVKKVGSSFRGMANDSGIASRIFKSHSAKTIALWTGLVLALGEGTATLGSGVGASLTALISSVSLALAAAGGIALAAVGGLVVQVTLAISALQRMKERVPGVQGAIENLSGAWSAAGDAVADVWGPKVISFLDTVAEKLSSPALAQAMGSSLAGITDAFTSALDSPGFKQFLTQLETGIPSALEDLGRGFANIFGGLGSIIAGATPVLQEFASQFESFFGEWANTMAEAAANGELQAFFARAKDSLDALFGLIGAVGGALGTLFAAGQDTGDSMLTTLTDLFNKFNEWMQSIEGQTALQEWFDNGERIFNALIDLGGDLGQTLGNLVTPESVERLINFMDGLGEFLPIAGEILELFGQLDVLNIFVGILNTIGAFLAPLLPPLQELATMVGETLVTAFSDLEGPLGRLGEALAPILQRFIELAIIVLPSVIDIVIGAITVMADIVSALANVSNAAAAMGNAFDVVKGIVSIVMDTITTAVTFFQTIASGAFQFISALLRGDFSGAFNIARDTVNTAFGQIRDFIQRTSDKFSEIGNAVQNGVQNAQRFISGFRDFVSGAFGGISSIVQGVINAFNNLTGAAGRANSAASSVPQRSASDRGSTPMAAGGLLNGPRRILAGEAGPEAIVPLNRALSQVDPSVRWLSALAQGKTPNFASGGVVGGRSVTVAEGAVTVIDRSGDPRRTANEVVNRVVERVAG